MVSQGESTPAREKSKNEGLRQKRAWHIQTAAEGQGGQSGGDKKKARDERKRGAFTEIREKPL